MKIVFFGSSTFSIPALKALMAVGYDIVAVVTVPDQAVGRKKVMTAPPLKTAALELGITVHQPASLKKDEQFFEAFASLAPELAVVAAYGKIIPERYLSVPKHGFLNIHPSLLPKYRGPTPVQSALLNGDKETGVTIMVVDKEMDHGPIVTQEKYDIWPRTTYAQLHDELAQLGATLLIDAIPKYLNGELKPQEQDHRQASIVKMYRREDGKIDWLRSHQDIYNQIRALNPEPGTWTMWRGKALNIKKAALEDGVLTPTLVQLEGGKEMPFADFLRGHPDFKLSDCQ